MGGLAVRRYLRYSDRYRRALNCHDVMSFDSTSVNFER